MIQKNQLNEVRLGIGINDDKAIKARDELAELLAKFFNCDIKTGIIDSKNNYIEF